MKIETYIDSLVSYAMNNGLAEPADHVVLTNRLLDILRKKGLSFKGFVDFKLPGIHITSITNRVIDVDEIERRIAAISQVDGTPCTVFAMAGFARFSKLGDVEAMKRYNRDRRLERRAAWHGSSGGESDVVASLLL